MGNPDQKIYKSVLGELSVLCHKNKMKFRICYQSISLFLALLGAKAFFQLRALAEKYPNSPNCKSNNVWCEFWCHSNFSISHLKLSYHVKTFLTATPKQKKREEEEWRKKIDFNVVISLKKSNHFPLFCTAITICV